MTYGGQPTTRRRIVAKLWIITALGLLVVVGSGCTARQSREQYDERLAMAAKVRDEVTEGLDSERIHTEPQLREAAAKLDAAVDELDADPPPRAAQAAHERMVAGLEGMSALVLQLGRCASLESAARDEARACRRAIEPSVYDDIRNDFDEANTIYREKGFTLPGTGGEGGDSGTGPSGEDPTGGDEL
ncbi:MAG: hypothetical protein JWM86_1679 [Thermoleophilia bacterium]|nr:hypothetical protein [Thermoleophilia bacterium]